MSQPQQQFLTVANRMSPFLLGIAGLSPDEALALDFLAHRRTDIGTFRTSFPILMPRLNHVEGGFSLLRGSLTGWERELSLRFPDNLPSYLDNLVRLGILALDYSSTLKNVPLYQALESEYADAFGQPMQVGNSIDFVRGVGRIPEYGQHFFAAVIPNFNTIKAEQE